jgi:hypothetical protein
LIDFFGAFFAQLYLDGVNKGGGENETAVKNAMLAGLMLLSGCAFTAAGRTKMYFDSDPPGATVDAEGQKCITPCEIEFRRGTGLGSVTAKFALEGHKSYEAKILAAKEGLIPRALLLLGSGDGGAVLVVGTWLLITSPISILASDAEWPEGITVILPELDSPNGPYAIPLQSPPPSRSKGGE